MRHFLPQFPKDEYPWTCCSKRSQVFEAHVWTWALMHCRYCPRRNYLSLAQRCAYKAEISLLKHNRRSHKNRLDDKLPLGFFPSSPHICNFQDEEQERSPVLGASHHQLPGFPAHMDTHVCLTSMLFALCSCLLEPLLFYKETFILHHSADWGYMK